MNEQKLLEITIAVNDKGVWTGTLNGFEANDLDDLGFSIHELPGQKELPIRRCSVSKRVET